MDVDDLLTSASVIEAKSSASAEGWTAVTSAHEVLREQWVGTRSDDFGTRADQVAERARKLLAQMDRIGPDLRAAITRYVDTDNANAAAMPTHGGVPDVGV